MALKVEHCRVDNASLWREGGYTISAMCNGGNTNNQRHLPSKWMGGISEKLTEETQSEDQVGSATSDFPLVTSVIKRRDLFALGWAIRSQR